MNARHEEITRRFFKTMDSHGDVFSMLTDDIEVMFPKWGIARGKEHLGRMYADLGPHIASISHDQSSFTFVSQEDRVCVEGVSSGELTDGTRWEPDGKCMGRFCTSFTIRDDGLISRIFIYIDPDYTDRTAGRYPWRQQPATTVGGQR